MPLSPPTVTPGAETVTGKRPAVFAVPKDVIRVPAASRAEMRHVPLTRRSFARRVGIPTSKWCSAPAIAKSRSDVSNTVGPPL